jgi:hypothetical protein
MKHNNDGKGAIANLSLISGFIAQPEFVTYTPLIPEGDFL